MPLPHEVTYRALEGIRKVVADLLGISHSSVDKYCTPPAWLGGDGVASPLEAFTRFVLAVQKAAPDGRERAKVLLDDLLASVGCLPAVYADTSSARLSATDLASASHEFGDVVQALAPAFDQDGFTVTDAIRLDRELVEHISVLGVMHHKVRTTLNEEDARVVRDRIGPRRALPAIVELRRSA